MPEWYVTILTQQGNTTTLETVGPDLYTEEEVRDLVYRSIPGALIMKVTPKENNFSKYRHTHDLPEVFGPWPSNVIYVDFQRKCRIG